MNQEGTWFIAINARAAEVAQASGDRVHQRGLLDDRAARAPSFALGMLGMVHRQAFVSRRPRYAIPQRL